MKVFHAFFVLAIFTKQVNCDQVTNRIKMISSQKYSEGHDQIDCLQLPLKEGRSDRQMVMAANMIFFFSI